MQDRQHAVLIVEDNPPNMALFHRILVGKDYSVLQASRPSEALTIASKHPVDIVLIDIKLPEMNGFRLLIALRNVSSYQNVPAIAVTANDVVSDRLMYKEAGFSAYLQKPVIPTVLLNAFADAFDEW
ncbi:MAG: response regulator [Chloroflexota bacterium]